MANTNDKFSATVSAWVRKSDERMLAVFRESAQRTVSLAQRRIPVDTGFARASVRASLEAMPLIDPKASKPKQGTFTFNATEIVLVIAKAKLGQTIYVGWTANYVGELERGHSQQAPSGFVRLAALQWKQTVREVSEEAKARVEANA
jgi:hypothetical protein